MKGDTYKETIHDGSRSYSVIRTAPSPGEGKHAKTPEQIRRRVRCSAIARYYERYVDAHKAYKWARASVYDDNK